MLGGPSAIRTRIEPKPPYFIGVGRLRLRSCRARPAGRPQLDTLGGGHDHRPPTILGVLVTVQGIGVLIGVPLSFVERGDW